MPATIRQARNGSSAQTNACRSGIAIYDEADDRPKKEEAPAYVFCFFFFIISLTCLVTAAAEDFSVVSSLPSSVT